MNDNVKFAPPSRNALTGATVSASSEASGLPVANILNPHVRHVTRTTGIENEWTVFVVSGGATTVNYVFLANHNLTKDAIVKWQGHSSDSWASPNVDISITVPTDSLGKVVPKIAYFFSNASTYEYWRLYVEDSGNSSSALEFGYIMAGRYIEPARNLRDGYTITTKDPSRTAASAGRMGYANIRKRYDEFIYQVFDMNEPMHDEIYAIFNEVGNHKALMVSLNPSTRPHHRTYYCQFEGDLGRQHRLLSNFNLQSVTFSEKN